MGLRFHGPRRAAPASWASSPKFQVWQTEQVCVPAAPARGFPAHSRPRSRRHTCPGVLPASPLLPAAPRGRLLGTGHARPEASPTHPAQPRESRMSRRCSASRSHRLNNYPAAPERPLPASASKPEGSLATIPTASVGRHRREGTPGKMPERLAGARRPWAAQSAELRTERVV